MLSKGPPHGFGHAITAGLMEMRGDAAVVMMADESDDCRDVVRYWKKLNEGWCVIAVFVRLMLAFRFRLLFPPRVVERMRGNLNWPRTEIHFGPHFHEPMILRLKSLAGQIAAVHDRTETEKVG